jgi:membrane-associated phospholipid phosphatase
LTSLPSPRPSLLTRRVGDRRLDVAGVSLRGWAIAGLIAALLVVICYRWVDRPTAILVHHMVRPGAPLGSLFESLSQLPDMLTAAWVTILLMLPLLVWRAVVVARARRPAYLSAIILIACSFALASTVKMLLKWSFGRTWPETWIRNNPSFIRDGLYGFFPFHGDAGWSAFPSGHMATVMSIAVIAWQLWPRLAPLWVAGAACAGVGLVAMNFHFVSDVIAGMYVGSASAATVLWIGARWNRRPHSIQNNSDGFPNRFDQTTRVHLTETAQN